MLRKPDDTRGLVLIETGQCFRYGLTDVQLEVFAGIPILVVFGDHLAESFNGLWQFAFDSCATFIERVNQAGGDAELLYPPERGIFGNSHMLMQDRNSLQIADLILDWIAEHVH